MPDREDALFERFRVRAEAVSAEVHRVGTQAQANEFVATFLRDEGGVAVGEASGLLSPVTRQDAAAAKIGISRMDWAIADTGTLVQDASAIEKRLVSTLPAIHIALVPTGALQPDLATMLAMLQPKQTSYISMITGPSRTADIERVLTIGVHGPARLVIVFVDEPEVN